MPGPTKNPVSTKSFAYHSLFRTGASLSCSQTTRVAWDLSPALAWYEPTVANSHDWATGPPLIQSLWATESSSRARPPCAQPQHPGLITTRLAHSIETSARLCRLTAVWRRLRSHGLTALGPIHASPSHHQVAHSQRHSITSASCTTVRR